jgi:putative MFS transporter
LSFTLSPQSRLKLTILVATLGYFVDLFDLILFVLVRTSSLKDLQVPPERMLSTGAFLLNVQMAGLLIGGIFWGVLGDRRGRLSVLLGSIVLYSFANLANAFVTSVGSYAAWRFIAGLGLAGELGAGVTIVSELLPQRIRGYGSTIIASIGLSGAIAAAVVAEWATWRHAYVIGGIIGLCLLGLRIGVRESELFNKARASSGVRGSWLRLMRQPRLVARVGLIALVGVPIWFVIGIIGTFTPEFGRALGMTDIPKVTTAILCLYAGMCVGDAVNGLLSQWWQSRRLAVLFALGLLGCLLAFYPRVAGISSTAYYATIFALGCGIGYWAMFVQIAAELFGTNYRATVATSVPNLVRGAVIPMTMGFQALLPALGVLGAGLWVGYAVLAVAIVAILTLPETFHRELDYQELI